jgi:alpha-glucosidase (family GH31 glycosyl hydrolase)
MHTKFWWENMKGKDYLGDLGIDNIKLDLKEIGWEGVDCIRWLRIGSSGGAVE